MVVQDLEAHRFIRQTPKPLRLRKWARWLQLPDSLWPLSQPLEGSLGNTKQSPGMFLPGGHLWLPVDVATLALGPKDFRAFWTASRPTSQVLVYILSLWWPHALNPNQDIRSSNAMSERFAFWGIPAHGLPLSLPWIIKAHHAPCSSVLSSCVGIRTFADRTHIAALPCHPACSFCLHQGLCSQSAPHGRLAPRSPWHHFLWPWNPTATTQRGHTSYPFCYLLCLVSWGPPQCPDWTGEQICQRTGCNVAAVTH